MNFALFFIQLPIFAVFKTMYWVNKLCMKKFIVFCLLCGFLFSISLFKNEYDFSKEDNLSVQIFVSDQNYNHLNEFDYVKNGAGAIVFCDYMQYKKIKKDCKNIAGVTFIFDGDEKTLNRMINDLGVKTTERTSSDFVGYTNYFDSSLNIDGKKTNVQGYLSENKVYIGFPLLLGSY